ncbi:MAG: Asp-tRNA(Asn)/Glu-tRNA(Gln) amidotransferase subunit GatC [Spirochaetota bacterium]
MNIDSNTIKWICDLAKLNLPSEEAKEIESQLTKILDYMEILNELDLEGVEPAAHTLEFTNVDREDRVGKSFSVETVKKLAPRWKNNHVEVPRVV